MVDQAGGLRIEGFHADRRLFQGAILGLMWLKCLSVAHDRIYHSQDGVRPVEDLHQCVGGGQRSAIVLSEAVDTPLLKNGGTVVLAAVGASFNFGVSVWRWHMSGEKHV